MGARFQGDDRFPGSVSLLLQGNRIVLPAGEIAHQLDGSRRRGEITERLSFFDLPCHTFACLPFQGRFVFASRTKLKALSRTSRQKSDPSSSASEASLASILRQLLQLVFQPLAQQLSFHFGGLARHLDRLAKLEHHPAERQRNLKTVPAPHPDFPG